MRSSLVVRLVATAISVVSFFLLYTATVIDSRTAATETDLKVPLAPPRAGARLDFVATAYCKGDTTSAGVSVQSGIAAADPNLLPEGSVIQLDGAPTRYLCIYTVMDTGPSVNGRHVDLYMWSCTEALDFGLRDVKITVLRLGWNPQNSSLGGGIARPVGIKK
jgi:3D (Asp-Asp-Asp) domain-containing protein